MGLWAVSLALVAWILGTADLHAIGASLTRAPWLSIAAIEFGSVSVGLGWSTWVTVRLLEALGVALPYRRLLLWRAASFAAQVVHPTGGTLLMSALARRAVPLSVGLGAFVLLDGARVFGLAFLAGIGFLAGFIAEETLPSDAYLGPVLVLLVGFVFHAVFWSAEPRLRALHRLSRRPFFTAFRALSFGEHLGLGLLMLPPTCISVALDYGILRLFGLSPGFFAFAQVYPLVMLIASVPVTVAGLGSYHLAVRALLLPCIAAPSLGAASLDAFATAVLFVGIAWKLAIGVLALGPSTRRP